MNDIDTQALRRLAEAAINAIRTGPECNCIGHFPTMNFYIAFTPPIAIELLDRLEAAEAVVNKVSLAVAVEGVEGSKEYRRGFADGVISVAAYAREWQKVKEREQV